MPKRILQGVVVSDKQDKTIVVKVERRFTHPLLKKTVRKTKNYHAHDEHNKAKVGDEVRIEESKPISKLKVKPAAKSQLKVPVKVKPTPKPVKKPAAQAPKGKVSPAQKATPKKGSKAVQPTKGAFQAKAPTKAMTKGPIKAPFKPVAKPAAKVVTKAPRKSAAASKTGAAVKTSWVQPKQKA